MSTTYIDSHGRERERPMYGQELPEPAAPVFTQLDATIAHLLHSKEKMDREWARDEAASVAQSRAGEQALLAELGAMLDPQLQQAVQDTQRALMDARHEAEQQRGAIATHEASRPSAGASAGDVRAWSGERALLLDMLETYTRNEAAAAASHQAARERLSAGLRTAYERRRAMLRQEIDAAAADGRAKIEAARTELARVSQEANAAVAVPTQKLNHLDRYWSGV